MESATEKTLILQNEKKINSQLGKSPKNWSIPADVKLEEAFKDMASPFNEPNVVIVFEESKLYVQKQQLVAVSPVFEAMFSSKFIEGSKKEITLPWKNLKHFDHFLRYLCPGFDDELTEDTVHHMLPLADEYDTDILMKRIEKFLVKSVLLDTSSITSEQIILKILEAEFYKLPGYLDECIIVASRKQFHTLTKCPKFKLKISFKRWEAIDKIYNNAVKVDRRVATYQENEYYGYPPKPFEMGIKDVGEHLKPYIQEN